MKSFNIYIIGVGGQGIGLLSETLLRSADHAKLKVKAVDTHGLAQRGGIVISHLRFGENVFSPLIFQNQADLVVALERHEALRAMNSALKDKGTLIYYDTAWQPLEIRIDSADPVTKEMIRHTCRKRNIREISVFKADLKDARMQNMVVLANIDRYNLIPGIKIDHYKEAIKDLMQGTMLKTNLKLFEEERNR
jgi:indolepyruvate ferredoxin oxidoreductase beta subunit